jgi:uncharacterized membrane protein
MGSIASSHSATAPRASWVRPKYLLFGFIGLMFAYVLVNNESFLIKASDPEWKHIESFKWWLLPHGLAAACALILGPMQFSDRLRQRYVKLHRVVGRIYIAGAFIAAPMGVYVQYLDEKTGFSRTFTIETVIQGGLWMLTTGIALAFILKGKVQQHRQWMTRSFGTGPLIFLEVRVISGLAGIESPAAIETVVWICTASSIFIADLVLQVQELLRSRPVAARTPVS